MTRTRARLGLTAVMILLIGLIAGLAFVIGTSTPASADVTTKSTSVVYGTFVKGASSDWMSPTREHFKHKRDGELVVDGFQSAWTDDMKVTCAEVRSSGGEPLRVKARIWKQSRKTGTIKVKHQLLKHTRLATGCFISSKYDVRVKIKSWYQGQVVPNVVRMKLPPRY